MASRRISKSSVDAAQPRDKDWLQWDDRLPGFGLKVTPAGSKVFLYQYRLGGRAAPVRRFTIGKFGKLTPDAARKIAEGLALKVAQGIDPQRDKVEQTRRSIDLAFKPYVERFAEGCLRTEWKATHKYAHSLLLTHAVPVLENKPLADISRKDINAVLAPLKDQAATAANVFAVIRRLVRWAVEQDDLERSPIEGMKGPKPPPSRDRVLDDHELALVWRACERLGYPFGPMVRLLILTGARREEVAGLDWSELDRTARVWTLPSSRSKNDVAARQPLSDLAVAELDQLAARAGLENRWPSRGLVLSTTGYSSISGYSRAKARLDKIVAGLAAEQDTPRDMESWRLHDLRRSVATGLQRLGTRFEVTESILNHVGGSKGGVAGIYQRHNWSQEKATALQAWADHVGAILSGANGNNVIVLVDARA
jgi:integrase